MRKALAAAVAVGLAIASNPTYAGDYVVKWLRCIAGGGATPGVARRGPRPLDARRLGISRGSKCRYVFDVLLCE
jgi:hypothetical protein